MAMTAVAAELDLPGSPPIRVHDRSRSSRKGHWNGDSDICARWRDGKRGPLEPTHASAKLTRRRWSFPSLYDTARDLTPLDVEGQVERELRRRQARRGGRPAARDDVAAQRVDPGRRL